LEIQLLLEQELQSPELPGEGGLGDGKPAGENGIERDVQIALGVDGGIELGAGQDAEYGGMPGEDHGVGIENDAAIGEIAGNTLIKLAFVGGFPGGDERVDLILGEGDGFGADGGIVSVGDSMDSANLPGLGAGGPTEKIEQFLVGAVGGILDLLSRGDARAIPAWGAPIEIDADQSEGDDGQEDEGDQVEQAFEPFHGDCQMCAAVYRHSRKLRHRQKRAMRRGVSKAGAIFGPRRRWE